MQTKILFDESDTRRSVADAVAALAREVAYADGDRARIDVGGLRLPSGRIVYLTSVVCEAGGRNIWVPLPASETFSAFDMHARMRKTFPTTALEGAMVSGSGVVELKDGRPLRAVEMNRAIRNLYPSPLDYRILECLIAWNNAQDRCYRDLFEGIAKDSKGQPTLRLLDCFYLADLQVPLLKQLVGRFEDMWPDQKAPSQQKIADALRSFGVRLPNRRHSRRPVSDKV
jgi:hypothetical protein